MPRRSGPARRAVTAKRRGSLGAAYGIRQRTGAVLYKVWEAAHEASVAVVREAMGEQDFQAAWAEGVALSTDEAIAYAQRGRGERKRPGPRLGRRSTPTELDVVRLGQRRARQ